MSDIFGGPPDDREYDPFGYPVDYSEVEDPYGFFGGDAPESWWHEEVTLYNDFGEEFTLTAQEWYHSTLEDRQQIEDFYGLDTLDIIHQLEDLGYWDADDWDTWRENYG